MRGRTRRRLRASRPRPEVAGEMTEREPHDGYLVLQGGVPEVQEFLENVWR